eukprot:scaffold41480_cov30-Attheya_sp.AAC.1
MILLHPRSSRTFLRIPQLFQFPPWLKVRATKPLLKVRLLTNLDPTAMITPLFLLPGLCLRCNCFHRQSSPQGRISATETVPSIVIDTGATDNFFNDKDAFKSYHKLPCGSYVRVANDVRVPILGTGRVVFRLADKTVSLRKAYHVAALRAPLLS